MLHQPSEGNPRLKGYKFHRSFKVALLLTMFIWILHHIKYSDDKPETNGRNTKSCRHIGPAGILVAAMADSSRDGLGSGEKIKPEGVPGELASDGAENSEMGDEEQDFPGNQQEKTWESIASHEGKGVELDTEGSFVNRKWKIEAVKEEEDIARGEATIADIKISEFQSFNDENGVPPWQEKK